MTDDPIGSKPSRGILGALAAEFAAKLNAAAASEEGTSAFVVDAIGIPTGREGFVHFSYEGGDAKRWSVRGPELTALLRELQEPEVVEVSSVAMGPMHDVHVHQVLRGKPISSGQARAMLDQGCDWQLDVETGAVEAVADSLAMGFKWMFRSDRPDRALRFVGPAVGTALGAIAAASGHHAISVAIGTGVERRQREEGEPRGTGL